MRAIVCNELGQPSRLVCENFPSPSTGSREIRLRVHAASVNFSDTLIIQGKYQLKPPLPFISGFEVAGEVIDLGSDVQRYAIGDRLVGLTCSGYGGFAEEAVGSHLLRMNHAAT